MKFSTKLILSGVIAAIIAVTLLSFSVFYQSRAILKDRIVIDQLELARHTMDEIDRVLYNAYQDIRLIGEDESLEEFLESEQLLEQKAPEAIPRRIEEYAILKVISRTMEEFPILTGPWDALMVFNKEGVIVASAQKEIVGKNIREYSGTRTAFYPALKGQLYDSDLVLSEMTGRPIVIFSAPIKSEITHEINGVVIGHFAWPVVMQILDEIPHPTHVHLFNRDGIVIAAPTEYRDEIL